MGSNDGFLYITQLDEVAHRGRRLQGMLEVDGARKVRGLRAELVRTQVSASSRTPTIDVVAEQEVSGPVDLVGGETFGFSLEVPDDMVPGFVTPHGSLTWSARVRADVLGSDPMCDEPVTIAPLPPERRGAGSISDTTATEIAAATRKRTESDQRGAVAIGIVFVAGSLLFLTMGIIGVGGKNPGAGRLAAFGMAAAFLVAGGLALSRRVRRTRDISVSTDATVYRPGDRVVVSASNPGGSPCTIGLQEVEIRLRVRGQGKSQKVDSPQHELAADWRDLPPGDHRMTFTLRPDALGSFGGRTIAVAHRVVVVPSGSEATAARRPLAEHHVVVIR